MELTYWSFTRQQGRQAIKAKFDRFPNSTVIFRSINRYYFVYTVNWSETDPIVTGKDLEEMGLLINKELGSESEFINRKSKLVKCEL